MIKSDSGRHWGSCKRPFITMIVTLMLFFRAHDQLSRLFNCSNKALLYTIKLSVLSHRAYDLYNAVQDHQIHTMADINDFMIDLADTAKCSYFNKGLQCTLGSVLHVCTMHIQMSEQGSHMRIHRMFLCTLKLFPNKTELHDANVKPVLCSFCER